MFTGIIEDIGEVVEIQQKDSNVTYRIQSPLAQELKIDQSLAHDGVCLTVVRLWEDAYAVTAIEETLKRTNLKAYQVGTKVNLERALKMNARLDGHVVQGHVDQVGKIKSIEDKDGSWLINVVYEDAKFITVEKGSICLNGISLTIVDSHENGFSVAIIPYTWEHTNLKDKKVGDLLNIEFDILGKYVQKLTLNAC